jgi:hypothetical protein
MCADVSERTVFEPNEERTPSLRLTPDTGKRATPEENDQAVKAVGHPRSYDGVRLILIGQGLPDKFHNSQSLRLRSCARPRAPPQFG